MQEPLTKMIITFKTKVDPEELKSLIFERRPLGLDFYMRTPVVIKSVNTQGHGFEKGVQEGWEVVSINNEDMTNQLFEVIHEKLGKAAAVLPNVA